MVADTMNSQDAYEAVIRNGARPDDAVDFLLRRLDEARRSAAHQHSTTDADTSKWIEWDGGECPLAAGTAFRYRLRDGGTGAELINLTAWRWDHRGSAYDIVAYQVSAAPACGAEIRLLQEDADERRMFNAAVKLMGGDPIQQVADALAIWHKIDAGGGSYSKMLAIYSNECHRVAEHLSRLRATPDASDLERARRIFYDGTQSKMWSGNPIPQMVEATAAALAEVRRATVEQCAQVCDGYGREGILERTYGCEVADELAARIRALSPTASRPTTTAPTAAQCIAYLRQSGDHNPEAPPGLHDAADWLERTFIKEPQG